MLDKSLMDELWLAYPATHLSPIHAYHSASIKFETSPPPSQLQLLSSTRDPCRRIPLDLSRPIPHGMRIPLRHRTRRLTRLGNRTTLVDRRQRHRPNLDVFPMFREKLFPVRQGAQLLVGEAAEVVC